MFFFFLCVEIPAAQQLSVYQPQMVQPGMMPQGLQVHKCYLYAEKNTALFYCVHLSMKNGFMNFAEWISANKYIPSSASTDGRRNAATHVHR